ncbi:MAG: RNA polymerase sigma factor RpoD, partial [Telluria sp.]
MKNTAKTLTLTAKKAPAKTTAQLSVPKTATSYFLETEVADGAPAAKVTVVKTRSRLASLKAAQAEDAQAAQLQPEQFDHAAAAGAAAADVVAEAVQAAEFAEPVAEPVAEPAAVAPAAAANDDYQMPVQATPAAPPVIVRKRVSKLAALKAAEAAET